MLEIGNVFELRVGVQKEGGVVCVCKSEGMAFLTRCMRCASENCINGFSITINHGTEGWSYLLNDIVVKAVFAAC
jgi:hypothetical protein